MTSWLTPVKTGSMQWARLLVVGVATLAVLLLSARAPWVSATRSTEAAFAVSKVTQAVPLAATSKGSSVVANDYASIFQNQVPELVNSGWSPCPGPITWSLDSRELTAAQTETQVRSAKWALEQWAQESGLSFSYVGEVPVNYNDSTFQLAPADGSPVAARHIYLTYLKHGQSKLLGSATLGFGAPSTVAVAGQEITGGNAVFRTDYVQDPGRNPVRKLRSLYLHELGHVLGLSHASLSQNIMYPIVDRNVTLGAGDVSGIHAMTKTCAAKPA
jgi:predicted Zn-dependent protease